MADKALVSACEGLGTAGDACPIVLPCDRQPWTGARGASCAVEPLPGYGYNPSAIPAPAFVKSLAQAAGYNVTYLGTTRKWRWSRHCQNEYTRRGDNGPGGLSGRPERSSSTATDVLLLGAELRVLGRVPLVGGHCMQHNHAAEDVRLLRVGEREVWASYVAFNHPDPRCAGGHWMARLAFSVAGTARRPRLHVSLEPTEKSCGVGLSLKAGRPLWSTRNAGLIVSNGVIAFELVRTSPVTEVVRAADSSRISHPAPPSLYGYSEHPNKVLSEWHNSINPLWIPELDGGCYLGVAHRHYLSRPTDAAVRRGVDQFKGVHGDTTARLGMAAHAHEPSDLVWQRARHWATKPMYVSYSPPLKGILLAIHFW
ncbi:hypothetical protein AB1Y20_008185 [Prymnesium parvum]|uniref:Amine oxidase n=1 Tax=Prymnesium parvum TaxID=97485 RepID=A0AB34IVV6_PRYPA